MGLTRGELLTKANLRSGGGATKILESLTESGFIGYSIPFGHKANHAVYRLVDEYSLFYFAWIQKAPRAVIERGSGDYWRMKRNTSSWKAWSGYAFEAICLKHVEMIKRALGISAVLSIESGWFHKPEETGGRGVQIDLVIDRDDNCITLCEMKYTASEFTIDRGYAAELQRKRNAFEAVTGTKKNVFTVMVTSQGVKENKHFEIATDGQVKAKAFFEH